MELTPIGEMRQVISINLTSGGTRGPSGAASPGSTPIAADVFAKIQPLHGRELVNAQQLAANVTHLVKLRYVAGVNNRCEVAFGSRTFDVNVAIDLEERNVELWLYCQEAGS